MMMIRGSLFLEFLAPYFWKTALRFHHDRMCDSRRRRSKCFQEVTVILDRNPNWKMLSRYAEAFFSLLVGDTTTFLNLRKSGRDFRICWLRWNQNKNKVPVSDFWKLNFSISVDVRPLSLVPTGCWPLQLMLMLLLLLLHSLFPQGRIRPGVITPICDQSWNNVQDKYDRGIG